MPFTRLPANAPALYSTLNDIFEELDDSITDLAHGDTPFQQLCFSRTSGTHILNGEIVFFKSLHAIDTQSNAASDDLDTISGAFRGDFLLLQCVSGARVVTVKHNTGNIWLRGGVDVALNDQRKVLPLVYDGTYWCEVGAGKWTSKLNLGTDTTLTIASDAITVTRARHSIDTQGGAPTDDLKTINDGIEGDVLILNTVSADRVVTIKTGIGNIKTRAGKDLTLDSATRVVMFVYNGTFWLEVTTDGLLAKDTLGADYAPVRSLQLPLNTLRAMSGIDAYEALVLPSPEVRSSLTIKAESVISNFFMSGDIEIDTGWGSAVEANAANGHYIEYRTTASANNRAYLAATTFDLIRWTWNPTFIAVVKFDGATTNRRVWIGLFDDLIGNGDNLGVLGNQGIGFRYSSNASDTTWQGVCSDGTTQTLVDTGVNIAGSTKFVLKFRVDSANNTVFFSVNNSTEVSISTNLPLETLDMGLAAQIHTLTAVARGLAVSRIYCEYD